VTPPKKQFMAPPLSAIMTIRKSHSKMKSEMLREMAKETAIGFVLESHSTTSHSLNLGAEIAFEVWEGANLKNL
jgi:hypothetical protein